MSSKPQGFVGLTVQWERQGCGDTGEGGDGNAARTLRIALVLGVGET